MRTSIHLPPGTVLIMNDQEIGKVRDVELRMESEDPDIGYLDFFAHRQRSIELDFQVRTAELFSRFWPEPVIRDIAITLSISAEKAKAGFRAASRLVRGLYWERDWYRHPEDAWWER